MAQLIDGSGLPLMEWVRLRVKDLDFGQRRLFVRQGKGNKDRVTVLPVSLISEIQKHLERVREKHHKDLEEGYGEAYLPGALSRKYPSAAKEFMWQYVFPSKGRSLDPRSGKTRRHFVMESGLQKGVNRASIVARIDKRVGCHLLYGIASRRTYSKRVSIFEGSSTFPME